jgi:hypothetical protein
VSSVGAVIPGGYASDDAQETQAGYSFWHTACQPDVLASSRTWHRTQYVLRIAAISPPATKQLPPHGLLVMHRCTEPALGLHGFRWARFVDFAGVVYIRLGKVALTLYSLIGGGENLM